MYHTELRSAYSVLCTAYTACSSSNDNAHITDLQSNSLGSGLRGVMQDFPGYETPDAGDLENRGVCLETDSWTFEGRWEILLSAFDIG